MLASPYDSYSPWVSAQDLDELVAAFQNDGLLLVPTETTWCIACSLNRPVAIQRLFKLRNELHLPFQPEVLVNDLDVLRSLACDLHPRIETLLAYHQRPLSICFPKHRLLSSCLTDEEGRAIFRLTSHPLCRQLMDALQGPLVTLFATRVSGQEPTHFGAISSSILERMDSVARWEMQAESEGISVLIQFDSERDEIRFLRE